MFTPSKPDEFTLTPRITAFSMMEFPCRNPVLLWPYTAFDQVRLRTPRKKYAFTDKNHDENIASCLGEGLEEDQRRTRAPEASSPCTAADGV